MFSPMSVQLLVFKKRTDAIKRLGSDKGMDQDSISVLSQIIQKSLLRFPQNLHNCSAMAEVECKFYSSFFCYVTTTSLYVFFSHCTVCQMRLYKQLQFAATDLVNQCYFQPDTDSSYYMTVKEGNSLIDLDF